MTKKFLPVLTLVAGLAPAGVSAQHVHGVIELGIVVEDDTVAVSLSAPLSDVIGFEHAPKNDAQAKLVQEAASMLSDPEAMFGLAESASCESSDMTIDGPDYVVEHLAVDDDHSDHHDHDEDHDDGHGHHDEHDDHDAHDGESEHEEHSEVIASYAWKCANVAELVSLDLPFTEKFSSVETVNIQVLTPAGADVSTAAGRVKSVSLSSP